MATGRSILFRAILHPFFCSILYSLSVGRTTEAAHRNIAPMMLCLMVARNKEN